MKQMKRKNGFILVRPEIVHKMLFVVYQRFQRPQIGRIVDELQIDRVLVPIYTNVSNQVRNEIFAMNKAMEE